VGIFAAHRRADSLTIYRFIEPRIGRARLSQWRWGALRVLLLLALIIVLSAVGLALLDNSENEVRHKLLLGLWNAVNLVSTLGDFSSFDERQKTFMMVAMLCVMVTGAYAITQLTGLLSSPEVVAYRENRRMEHALDKLSGHVVVIGYVGLGKLLANQLRESGRHVVVIDRDETNASLASESGFTTIKGDAGVDDGVLHSARIARAHALFVTTAEPQRNLTLTLMSHTLNPALRIVVAGSDERWGQMLRRAGASDVVIADRLLADSMLACLGAGTASVPRREAGEG
jgi:voltage-gated potassium channel